MAALIPILLPHIIQATTNIGIGVANAIQGDSSNVSLQIGSKVFTTKKRFSFGSLPPELRQKIILMAMEESKDLILPTPYFFDPTQPLTAEQIAHIQSQHPLYRGGKNYRSIVGDRVSANGYPISTWRWATVSTEWRDIVRRPLWTNLEILGHRPYTNLLARLKGKDGFEVMGNVRSITIREGFDSAQDIYTILSHPSMTQLEHVSILPDYPTSFHQLVPPVPPFLFGFQLIRSRKPMRSLTYGLPLESTTNPASRQQLRSLHPPRLTISVSQPSTRLFTELKDLVAETTDRLTIRYIPLRSLTDHQVFLCEPLQEFKQIHLYLNLPRPRMIMTGPVGSQTIGEDPQSPVTVFIAALLAALEASSSEIQDRYTVWKVEGWDAAGQVDSATRTRIWPVASLFEFDFDEDENPDRGRKARAIEEEEPVVQVPSSSKEHWERETNLKLFGGLLSLSLESKKH